MYVQLKGNTLFYHRVCPVDGHATQSARRVDLTVLKEIRIEMNGQQHSKDKLCLICAGGKAKEFRAVTGELPDFSEHGAGDAKQPPPNGSRSRQPALRRWLASLKRAQLVKSKSAGVGEGSGPRGRARKVAFEPGVDPPEPATPV